MKQASRDNRPYNTEAGAHLLSNRLSSLTSLLNKLMSMLSITAEERCSTKKLKIFGKRSSGMNQNKKALRKLTFTQSGWKELTKSGRLKIEISIGSSSSRAHLDQLIKDRPSMTKVIMVPSKLAPWTRLITSNPSSYTKEDRVRCKTKKTTSSWIRTSQFFKTMYSLGGRPELKSTPKVEDKSKSRWQSQRWKTRPKLERPRDPWLLNKDSSIRRLVISMLPQDGSLIRLLQLIMANLRFMLMVKGIAILLIRIKIWWPSISMPLQVNKRLNIRRFSTQRLKPASTRLTVCVSPTSLKPNSWRSPRQMEHH